MRQPRETIERLYLVERLTTRQIGAHFGVSKTEVVRWMKHYGMARRPTGHGLHHRGVTAPTRDELEAMIHCEHLSYEQIGQRYGVDGTAVQHWVRKHGIRPPTLWETRRKGRVVTLPTPDELRALYARGFSLEHVGWMHGVSAEPIFRIAKEIGLRIGPGGWNPRRRWTCEDGHAVRSTFEMRVDDWLHANGIMHTIEPRIPHAGAKRADFLADGWYIEVWGIKNRPSYLRQQQKKRDHYRSHDIPLIELSLHDFSLRSPDLWQATLSAALGVKLPAIPA